MNNKQLFSVILIILVLIGGGLWLMRKNDRPMVEIGNTKVQVELADSNDERSLGLSGRESLPEDHGMLFVFEDMGHPSIWMKDMRFSIDIIWISEDRKIIDIKERISPATYPQSFIPISRAKYVLEVNSGFTSDRRIKIGDLVKLP